MIDETEAHLALRARLLSYDALPADRAWENIKFTPRAGHDYVMDRFVPGTSELWTVSANGGRVEETGLYRITYFGAVGTGIDAIRGPMSAIKLLFAPGSPLGTLASGGALRVRTNPGPRTGEMIPIEGGRVALTLTVPWTAQSVNAVVTP